MIKCWRESCKRWITAWRLESLQVETRCGYTGSLAAIHHYDSRNFLTDRIERLIADKVMPILKQADLPAPMFLATRFSKAADRSYLAYCCPFCNSLQGDTPLNHRSVHWRSYVVEGWLPLPISQDVLSHEHLCMDVGRGHCIQEPQAPEGPIFPDGEAHWVRATPELLVSELPPLPRRGERKAHIKP
jgi:competence protein CoiA